MWGPIAKKTCENVRLRLAFLQENTWTRNMGAIVLS